MLRLLNVRLEEMRGLHPQSVGVVKITFVQTIKVYYVKSKEYEQRIHNSYRAD